MSKLNLEVGKTYVTRDGEGEGIVLEVFPKFGLFSIGCDVYAVLPNGRILNDKEHPLDLIALTDEELPDESD